jgi:hypothetical protein
MVALMGGTGLPLIRYSSGLRVVYTADPFGPCHQVVYNWARSSPVRFTERHVEKALASGLVELAAGEGEEVRLSDAGRSLVEYCTRTWGPSIDEYFKGYGVDWRKMR